MTDELESEEQELWRPFRYFLGKWRGTSTGRPGVGRSKRSYSLILNGRFLQVSNRSIYEPQENNPQGEIHEDLGLISYDKTRQKYVLREFHVEGYVNQYLMEDWDAERRTLVMVTEALENIPDGWGARTSYEILGDDHFRETFDLAGPGREWACYITTDFERDETV